MAQTRTCPACGTTFPAQQERCPTCGKDSKFGTQNMSLMITFVLLMLFPLIVLAVMLFAF